MTSLSELAYFLSNTDFFEEDSKIIFDERLGSKYYFFTVQEEEMDQRYGTLCHLISQILHHISLIYFFLKSFLHLFHLTYTILCQSICKAFGAFYVFTQHKIIYNYISATLWRGLFGFSQYWYHSPVCFFFQKNFILLPNFTYFSNPTNPDNRTKTVAITLVGWPADCGFLLRQVTYDTYERRILLLFLCCCNSVCLSFRIFLLS